MIQFRDFNTLSDVTRFFHQKPDRELVNFETIHGTRFRAWYWQR